MKPLDSYFKAIFTIIAACLLWGCFLTTLDHAAPARAATAPSERHSIVSESAEGPVIDMATHHQFKVGDRVRRRTGGPIMTIESILKEPEKPVGYYCVWFTGEARHRVRFTANELVAAKSENTVP